MTKDELRNMQTPIKDRYRQDAAAAQTTIRVTGELDVPRLICRIETGRGAVTEAGLHPMAGGDPKYACSADMLLESLIGCAGVTLCAVATAMEIPISGGKITAEGDLDFRGTLGISKEVPIGFSAIRLLFELQTTAEPAQLDKLAQLAERYCVVAQSLSPKPTVTCRAV